MSSRTSLNIKNTAATITRWLAHRFQGALSLQPKLRTLDIFQRIILSMVAEEEDLSNLVSSCGKHRSLRIGALCQISESVSSRNTIVILKSGVDNSLTRIMQYVPKRTCLTDALNVTQKGCLTEVVVQQVITKTGRTRHHGTPQDIKRINRFEQNGSLVLLLSVIAVSYEVSMNPEKIVISALWNGWHDGLRKWQAR